MYDLITVNAGHNKHVQGANSKYGKEHVVAREVAKALIKELKSRGQKVVDTTCDCHKTASGILRHQVQQSNAHNKSNRLDVSVHLNSFNGTAKGTEVLYYSERSLADKVSKAIAEAGGFTNRGAKERKELYFLLNTNAPAILIEVCFIDNKGDMDKYKNNFDKIINAIADSITKKKSNNKTKTQSNNSVSKPKKQPSKSSYTGDSVVDYLKSKNQPSSFAHRKKLAQQYGIKNYSGTAAQNTRLLNALRGGKTTATSTKKYTPKSYKVGSKVKIKSSAKTYSRSTAAIPARYKN